MHTNIGKFSPAKLPAVLDDGFNCMQYYDYIYVVGKSGQIILNYSNGRSPTALYIIIAYSRTKAHVYESINILQT